MFLQNDSFCNRSATFNERFIQFQAHVLGTHLKLACLTKLSSHTSLVLTNSGLVATTLGPNNLC